MVKKVATPAIGIDLGTSNTCVSRVHNGKPEVMPTRFGSKTIPSVVALGDGGRPIVGEAAAKRMVLYPDQTVYGSKRLIGRAYRRSVAQAYQPHFAWRIVETEEHRFGASPHLGANGCAWLWNVVMRGARLAPTERHNATLWFYVCAMHRLDNLSLRTLVFCHT